MPKRLLALILILCAALMAQSRRWTAQEAAEWYGRQPWLVGADYIPSYAVNQLEMWQADTFNEVRINMELGWAQQIGMNTMRVFLHDQAWQQDPGGFKRRMERFLKIADRHKIKILFVLFDSCWDPFPHAGPQPAPRPGIHNSGWVQSPGATALMDPAQTHQVLEYVQDVVAAFATDKRVLGWDVWNEPDNTNDSSYGSAEPKNKTDMVLKLLPRAFEYARAGLPVQPLTSGVWHGDWSFPAQLTPMEKIQVDLSDVVSFHNYGKPAEFEQRVKWLEQYKRPILCTEYMARPQGSTFEGILPIARKYRVAAYNWGLVAGKTQTFLPWDSWQQPYIDRQPEVWFHDIFHTDGTPYRQREVQFIREITGKKKLKKAA